MSRTTDLASKLVFEALKVLKENDGELPSSLLMEELSKRVPLDDWAKGILEKTGNIRWQSILHFYSIDLIKAGYLLKKKGIWYLTPEGEKSLEKGEKDLLKSAQALYKIWKEKNKDKSHSANKDIPEEQIEEASQKVSSLLDDARSKANQSFTKFILEEFDPYTFQELCGALFRGMGYYPLLLKYIQNQYIDKDIYMIVDEENIPSIKGIEKAGFKKFGFGIKEGKQFILKNYV